MPLQLRQVAWIPLVEGVVVLRRLLKALELLTFPQLCLEPAEVELEGLAEACLAYC